MLFLRNVIHKVIVRNNFDTQTLFSAINDFQKASSMDEGNRRAQEGLNKAQKLLKQSQKKDYYKILGVKRCEESYQFKCIKAVKHNLLIYTHVS